MFELFGGEIEKIRLQKLLFLFTKLQSKSEYDFVPYKFGCFSYSANADLTTMVRQGTLTESESAFKTTKNGKFLSTLKEQDRKQLAEVKRLYGNMTSEQLMKHTYVNYPYYATKSIKAKSILTKAELAKVDASRAFSNETVLFTIGYEGISLEEYLNRLLRNDVKVLVDVRNNPLSMKYGFSKSQLQKFCDNLGILYIHIPEVGIRSEKRQELNTQTDYDKLFVAYRKSNLAKTGEQQQQILKLLVTHKRIAMTCFEANICQCHRKPLADAIERLDGFKYSVKHI
jgi:uncharacterized protein (DUF488 family)